MIRSMNVLHLVERSLRLSRQHTVLWKLGLLALLAELVTSSVLSGPVVPTAEPSAEETAKATQLAAQIETWIIAHTELIIAVSLVSAAVLAVMLYISIRAKIGAIAASASAEDGKPMPTTRQALQAARGFMWRLLGFYLVFGLIVGLMMSAVSSLMAAIYPELLEGNSLVGWTIVALLFLISIVVVGYATFITKMTERAVVLERLPVLSAVTAAHRLLRDQTRRAVRIVLIDFGLQIAFLLFLTALVIIGVGLAGLVGLLLAAILPQTVMAAVVGAAVVLAVIGFTLLAGWFAAVMIIFWTLAYRSLRVIASAPK